MRAAVAKEETAARALQRSVVAMLNGDRCLGSVAAVGLAPAEPGLQKPTFGACENERRRLERSHSRQVAQG